MSKQEPVICKCGDEYPSRSYGAGFIHGAGMCPNCDVALSDADKGAEPVAWRWSVGADSHVCTNNKLNDASEPLYTHPAPMRELTEDEILTKAHRICWKYRHTDEARYQFNDMTILQFARAILKEAKEEV